jgi:DNA-directed RNA polymerase specialized sigma24 family protein
MDLDGLTADQAGEAVGVKAATMRTRLFHARREIRASMAHRLL